jgi:hypothetical protein
MSDQKLTAAALQGIASELMPTLLEGLSAKEKKEKLSTAPKEVRKKVRKKIRRPQRRVEEEKKEEGPRMSFADLLGQDSASEKKFFADQKKKATRPKKKR